LFYNLVNNALKFSSKSQAAHIQLRWREAPAEILQKVGLPHTSPYHLITVSDNGIGFPSHLSERIFVPFARLHTKDAYEGTGLGLSLCRKIVERHAGAMYAEGAEGQGATIYVLLPA
jgi:signal transduction histidine kinase